MFGTFDLPLESRSGTDVRILNNRDSGLAQTETHAKEIINNPREGEVVVAARGAVGEAGRRIGVSEQTSTLVGPTAIEARNEEGQYFRLTGILQFCYNSCVLSQRILFNVFSVFPEEDLSSPRSRPVVAADGGSEGMAAGGHPTCFISDLVGLSVPYWELFGGRSCYKESNSVIQKSAV